MRFGVLVSGGGTNLQAIMDAMDAGKITNATLEVVISNKKDAYALERAKGKGIEAVAVSPKDYATRDEFNKALLETIDSYKLDLIVLAGFLVVLPAELVKKYENKIINIHPSLIPSFCGDGFYGLKVHEKALERGVKITGATVHFVDEGTDTGPIIKQKAVAVREDDTPETLQRRVMEEAEWQILPEVINELANK
ncbi:MAG TPA: phosphoribosylglycinamide formyltransferase [Eubacterium sp.]|nr:phosphoribosylglycinamide formyltransferase [Eubacterium sp.]